MAAALFFVAGTAPGQSLVTPERLLEQGARALAAGDAAAAVGFLTSAYEQLSIRVPPPSGLDEVLFQIALAQFQSRDWPGLLQTIARYEKDQPRGRHGEVLAFLRAFAHLQSGSGDEAAKGFGDYVARYPTAPLAPAAAVFAGAAPKETGARAAAAETLKTRIPQLPGPLRSWAVVLAFSALIDGERPREAAEFFLSLDDDAADDVRRGAIVLLALELMDDSLLAEDPGLAVRVGNRIPDRGTLLTKLNGDVERFEKSVTGGSVSAPVQLILRTVLQGVAVQARGDLTTLEAFEDYDLTRLLRLATAYLEQGRPHEAVILLEDAVAHGGSGEFMERAEAMRIRALSTNESWPRVVAASGEFQKNHPSSPFRPGVLIMEGEARLRLADVAGAHGAFEAVVAEFPNSPEAAAADFLRGYALILLDRNAEANEVLDAHAKRFPQSAFKENASYWAGMSRFYAKDYPAAIKQLEEYAARAGNAGLREDARFRAAQSRFNSRDFAAAEKALIQFRKDFPRSGQADEARNMLGDSCLAQGQVDAALEAYREIPVRSGTAYDYAAFRIDKVFEAGGDAAGREAHLREFLEKRPQSPRVPQAIAALATLAKARDDAAAARELYWSALRDHGNNPEAEGVEDILRGLQRLYPGEEGRETLLEELSGLEAKSRAAKQETLQSRLLAARASLIRRNEPEVARELLLQAASEVPPKRMPGGVLADVADALREVGRTEEAGRFYHTLRSWYPRTPWEPRGHAGLGFLAVDSGDDQAAAEHFERFRRTGPRGPQAVAVARAEAGILERAGRPKEAIARLEGIVKTVRGRAVAEVLNDLGRLHLAAGQPKEAIPYFQRVYIAHGKWSDLVAVAYLESGKAFEQLGMKPEARRTYEELLSEKALASTPEIELAKKRLEALGPASTNGA